MVWLAALMIVTWRIMRRIDTTIAWITALSFGSLYFKAGAAMTLQRDYVGILPIAVSLLIVLQEQWKIPIRAALAGVLFGVAASMKPHLIVGLPIIMWLLIEPDIKIKTWKLYINVIGLTTLGFIVSFVIPLLWLLHVNAMPSFLDMLLNYMPLYLDLDGFVETHDGWKIQWQGYFMIFLSFVTLQWLMLLGMAIWQGNLVTHPRTIKKKLLIALVLLVMAYIIYPFPANKFYNYHWMPFRYFGILLAGYLLLPVFHLSESSFKRKLMCCVAYVLFMSGVAYPVPVEMVQNIYLMTNAENEKQHVLGDDVGDYLLAHASPGDLVQPLDTGGAALRGMLQAKVVMATPYSTFQDLFHHYDDAIIQKMRTVFIHKLMSSPPKFIVDTYTTPDEFCSGGSFCSFNELSNFVSNNYRVSLERCAADRCRLRIYERK